MPTIPTVRAQYSSFNIHMETKCNRKNKRISKLQHRLHASRKYCDILLIYGQFGPYVCVAARKYSIYFPERRRPDRNVFSRLIHRIRETGYVMPNRNVVVEVLVVVVLVVLLKMKKQFC